VLCMKYIIICMFVCHVMYYSSSLASFKGSTVVSSCGYVPGKNAIVAALEKDLTLIDPSSGTVGVIDRHNCVVLTRNDEHMEGRREYSRIKADKNVSPCVYIHIYTHTF
jgi:hypothetical protein